MLDYAALQPLFHRMGWSTWWLEMEPQVRQTFSAAEHGDFKKWQAALAGLPELGATHLHADQDTISLRSPQPLTSTQRATLEAALRQLHPWRKGPFDFFGIGIDTEWRSDWKWQRLSPHIQPLGGRLVLDIGCGSGYHLWRMHAEGATTVLGIDPALLANMQFLAVNRYVHSDAVYMLPIGVDALPAAAPIFDTVFSMGVLYHRQSPLEHLARLKGLLRPNGELVLETLVIRGNSGNLLFPEDRYAKMRNVWFIPSVELLTTWLRRSGFQRVRVVDVSLTSLTEQRSTDWMRFQSLVDFLDPTDHNKTVEGYPAPVRAIVIAEN